jgi:hypothetical protein
MDPITTAIVAALVAGITQGTTKVGENAISSAYEALKTVIKRKLGTDSKVTRAIQYLEEEPESEGYRAVLKEQIAKAKADQDSDILKAANLLKETISATPDGEKHIMNAVGSNIAQADRGSTSTVHVNQAKDEK